MRPAKRFIGRVFFDNIPSVYRWEKRLAEARKRRPFEFTASLFLVSRSFSAWTLVLSRKSARVCGPDSCRPD